MSASPNDSSAALGSDIPDVIVIEPPVFADERGWFAEVWRSQWAQRYGIPEKFLQENESASRRGVLRGLHYQLGCPQGKLVRVAFGEVFDVAVDLRRSSPTFGQWAGVRLSADNHRLVWIPAGFAHGFVTLSDHAVLVYKCTEYYAPAEERVIRWDDPDLAIAWPMEDGYKPMLSDKDAAGVPFAAAETYL